MAPSAEVNHGFSNVCTCSKELLLKAGTAMPDMVMCMLGDGVA